MSLECRQRIFYEQQRQRCEDLPDKSARLSSTRKANYSKSLDLMSITRLLDYCPREEPVIEKCFFKSPAELPAHAGIRPSAKAPATLKCHTRDADPHKETASRPHAEAATPVARRLQVANGNIPLMPEKRRKFPSRQSPVMTEKETASAYFSKWSVRSRFWRQHLEGVSFLLFLDPATIVDLLHSNELSPTVKPLKEGFASFAIDGIGLLGASTPPRIK